MVRDTFAENPRREIEVIEGRWVPKGRGDAWAKYSKTARDMEFATHRCKERRLAIQAGGNIGAWPTWLAKRFKEVMTFEPEDMNYRCLVRNMERYPNVETYNAALGNEEGRCELKLAKSLGGHHMTLKPGSTVMLTIDSFKLEHLDYIMLDIEGWEYEALQGGLDTIARCRPVIQIEDRGHGEKKGNGKTFGDILRLLPSYQATQRVGRDVILEWYK